MLNRAELEKYRQQLGFTIWQIERDYLQHLFLLFLSRRVANELVFKGGTALQKTLGLNRFSIDLDFTQQVELPGLLFSHIEKDLSSFGFPAQAQEERKRGSLKIKFKIEGPLYQGTERTLTVLWIEINMKEKIVSEPELKEIFPIYPDLQPYLIKVMKPEEMLAEKVRAIFTRAKARDVFDLRFLLMKGIALQERIIMQKLEPYHWTYSRTGLLGHLKKVEKIWQKELGQLVTTIPNYQEVIQQIKGKI